MVNDQEHRSQVIPGSPKPAKDLMFVRKHTGLANDHADDQSIPCRYFRVLQLYDWEEQYHWVAQNDWGFEVTES